MAGIRFSVFKSLGKSINHSSRAIAAHRPVVDYANHLKVGLVRPLFADGNYSYNSGDRSRLIAFGSRTDAQLTKPSCVSSNSPTLFNSRVQSGFPWVSVTSVFGYRSYSLFSGGKTNDTREPLGPEASGTREINVGDGAGAGREGEWVDKLKDAWKSVADVATTTGEKVKEVSNELIPQAQQILDSHPDVRDVVLPVGGTMTATMLAWLVMPKLLRKLHKYSTQRSPAFLSGSIFGGDIPYEKSFWGALEDPVRYTVTFMTFSQIAIMVGPDAIASQYMADAWRGALILSFVWFLHRWKTNVFARALAAQSVIDREKLLTLDKLSSVGLFVIGSMALAEACGVAVQSILTVGGIGGVATAFAARDILGNVLSGLSIQFSRPFSLGDTIKAGPVEGQVVEMGLTTTALLNAERFPVIVPNSMFSSQVIVNKSRAQWRSLSKKIPLQSDNLDKIPQISDDIKSMLRSYPKVFLGKEVPYCFLSHIESSYAELTLGCNLTRMSKDELYATEQDILLQAVQIIKHRGLTLGSYRQDL